MALNLQKPLAFFDLETTGINITKDRIIELHILKVFPNQEKQSKTFLLNPTIPIPKEVTLIHGIADEDVKDCPTFEQKAQEILDFFGDADLAGYNSNRFDIPLITEEFLRVNVDFKLGERKQIDVQNIFHKMEKRTLEAALKFYCQKDLVNAHSAEADTVATYEILEAQLERYPELINNVDYLSEFTIDQSIIDNGRRLIKEQGKICFNFGKYKGVPVEEVFKKDTNYYSWIMNSDFALDTKQKLKEIKTAMKMG